MPKLEIENKSPVTIHGLKPGARRKIDVDENGTPLDVNWRRRLRDSSIDGAIIVIEEQKVKPQKTKKEEKKEMEG